MRKSRLLALAAASAAVGWSQQIHIEPVRGNIYVLSGAGANITISAGKDGVVLVDSGSAQMSDQVIAAINSFSRDLAKEGKPKSTYPPPKPIVYIANTSSLPDRAGGNPGIAQAGRTFTGGNVSGQLANATE